MYLQNSNYFIIIYDRKNNKKNVIVNEEKNKKYLNKNFKLLKIKPTEEGCSIWSRKL